MRVHAWWWSARDLPLTDFQEVTASIESWDDWCSAWSARAAIHEALGNTAHGEGFNLSAAEHWTRAAVCYHFGKFLFVEFVNTVKAHMRSIYRKLGAGRRREAVVTARQLGLL